MSSGSMKAWRLKSYLGIGGFSLIRESIPSIVHPNEVLVKILSASVNSVDNHMSEGYGRIMFSALRSFNDCKSMRSFLSGKSKPDDKIMGRDFFGSVVEVGQNVKKFSPGMLVCGTPDIRRNGSFAEYCVVSDNEISESPNDSVECTALPFIACTVFGALKSVKLSKKDLVGKRVYVLGGAGGIGTFCVQLFAHWKCKVVSSCSAGDIPLVKSLGADIALDYSSPSFQADLKEASGDGFDFFLDPLGLRFDDALEVLAKGRGASYVSLKSTLVSNVDSRGIFRGLCTSALDYRQQSEKMKLDGRKFSWGFFSQDQEVLKYVSNLVKEGHIKPVVDSIFPFEKLPEALDKLKSKHPKGKVLVSLT